MLTIQSDAPPMIGPPLVVSVGLGKKPAPSWNFTADWKPRMTPVDSSVMAILPALNAFWASVVLRPVLSAMPSPTILVHQSTTFTSVGWLRLTLDADLSRPLPLLQYC